MTRVVDFDAARRERKREPVRLIISGRTHELTSGVPAGLALDMLRFRVVKHADDAPDEHDCSTFGCEQTDDIDIPDAEVIGVAERLFGPTVWAAVLEDLDLDELPALVEMTFRALNGEDDGLPNPEPPTAAAEQPASAGSATGR